MVNIATLSARRRRAGHAALRDGVQIAPLIEGNEVMNVLQDIIGQVDVDRRVSRLRGSDTVQGMPIEPDEFALWIENVALLTVREEDGMILFTMYAWLEDCECWELQGGDAATRRGALDKLREVYAATFPVEDSTGGEPNWNAAVDEARAYIDSMREAVERAQVNVAEFVARGLRSDMQAAFDANVAELQALTSKLQLWEQIERGALRGLYLASKVGA